MKKKNKLPDIIIFCALMLALLAVIIIKNNTQSPKTQQRGMFEWTEEAVYDTKSALELIQKLSITRWYQEFPSDNEAMAEFTQFLHDNNVGAYALIGSVEWGFEEDGASLTKALEELVEYNKSAEIHQRLDGVMIDVEPYTSSRFKKEPEKYMDYYVSGMTQAYRAIQGSGLSVIICIPRHYDENGLTDGLEKLIANACDEVAVMNYDCGNEVEKIKTEAILAQQYDKELHCILEFQRVGKHGLTEEKTYRNKGLDAAHAAFEQVSKAYEQVQVVWDYHYAKPIYEMLAQAQ